MYKNVASNSRLKLINGFNPRFGALDLWRPGHFPHLPSPSYATAFLRLLLVHYFSGCYWSITFQVVTGPLLFRLLLGVYWNSAR